MQKRFIVSFSLKLAIFIVLLACGACRGRGALVKQDQANNNKGTPAASHDNRPSDENEGVSGYNLVCSYLKKPVATSPQAELGCKIANDHTKEKVDLAKIAQSWRWDFQISSSSDVTASVAEQDAGNPWHAIYSFKGTNADAVWQASQNAHILVPLVLISTGDTIMVDEPVREIEWPIEAGGVGTGNESAPAP